MHADEVDDSIEHDQLAEKADLLTTLEANARVRELLRDTRRELAKKELCGDQQPGTDNPAGEAGSGRRRRPAVLLTTAGPSCCVGGAEQSIRGTLPDAVDPGRGQSDSAAVHWVEVQPSCFRVSLNRSSKPSGSNLPLISRMAAAGSARHSCRKSQSVWARLNSARTVDLNSSSVRMSPEPSMIPSYRCRLSAASGRCARFGSREQ